MYGIGRSAFYIGGNKGRFLYFSTLILLKVAVIALFMVIVYMFLHDPFSRVYAEGTLILTAVILFFLPNPSWLGPANPG